MLTELLKRLEEKEERMIEIRRYLHAHPELSFEETETAKYIAEFYEGKDADVQTGVGGNGVVVTIKGRMPGKTVAIRADFDALPITEESGVPFASKNPGVMHACGHDAHTAYMLVLAETLIEMKDQLHGTVKIIHQHAEETPPGGAIGMIKDGALEGVDAIFGAHVISTMPTGLVAYRSGEMMSGRANFKLTIQGKGGHGSSPHLSNDAIVAGSYFVTAVQTIVSRRVNPFDMVSVTIGSFDGKGSFNVIKDKVELEGDVRTMSEENRVLVEKEMKRIVRGIEEEFGVTIDLCYENDYPVLVNDKAMTEFVVETLQKVNLPEIDNVIEAAPQAPSEDFAYYLQEKPGSFFFVGAQPRTGTPYWHHHPKFIINEESILTCAKAMGSIVVEYLNGE